MEFSGIELYIYNLKVGIYISLEIENILEQNFGDTTGIRRTAVSSNSTVVGALPLGIGHTRTYRSTATDALGNKFDFQRFLHQN